MNWTMRTLTVLVSAAILVVPIKQADAAVIETPDHDVIRVELVYAEPTPTPRFPARHYFETLDGAAYTYGTYGQCVRANDVPDRICRTVFWYAR